MKKTFTFIKNGIFHGHTLFSCGYSYKQMLNKLNEFENKSWFNAINYDKAKELFEDCHACCSVEIKDGIKYPIIFFKYGFKFKKDDYIILAHELVHLNQFYLSEFIDRDKEIECEAYFHTYMMKECLNALN